MGWISTHKSTLSSLPVCDDQLWCKSVENFDFPPIHVLNWALFCILHWADTSKRRHAYYCANHLLFYSSQYLFCGLWNWTMETCVICGGVEVRGKQISWRRKPKNPMRTIEGKSEVYYRLTRCSNGLLMYGRLVFVANEVMERGKKGCSGSYCCNSTLT